MSEGSGAKAVRNVSDHSWASAPQEPPNSSTRTSDPAFTAEATPSCCHDPWPSSPPAGEEFIVIDGPLPAGVQPLCDLNSSSSSAPAAQTGLINVDGLSSADDSGFHSKVATAEMSSDSAHTHRDPPSSVCMDTGCTGSSSDGSAADRQIFQMFALLLCAFQPYKYCNSICLFSTFLVFFCICCIFRSSGCTTPSIIEATKHALRKT